jgi:hypothetical protein
MSTATLQSSAELHEEIAKLDAELKSTRSKLLKAFRDAARAFLGGTSSDEVQSLRTQIRRLQDLLIGLHDLAALTELDELNAEIERRERQYEKDAERLVELKRAGTRKDAVIEGAGNRFGVAMRADREDRIDAFSVYEEAHHAHIAEAQAIESLRTRRDELARTPQAFFGAVFGDD